MLEVHVEMVNVITCAMNKMITVSLLLELVAMMVYSVLQPTLATDKER